jgi:hypothetical protein
MAEIVQPSDKIKLIFILFYIDNIQKAVVICLIIPTTFPFDAGSRVDNVRHIFGYFFMLDPASTGNIVGTIRQMTTAF